MKNKQFLYQYHFSRFHIHALIYDICFSFSDLLHSVWQTPGPSLSLWMTQSHSFLWLSNSPLEGRCSIYNGILPKTLNVYVKILEAIRPESWALLWALSLISHRISEVSWPYRVKGGLLIFWPLQDWTVPYYLFFCTPLTWCIHDFE